MDIKKTGILCEQFLKSYKGISNDLTKCISDVLISCDDDNNFDSSIASEATKLWWIVLSFAPIISDNEVFNDMSLLNKRAEIISDSCNIKQEYIVESFKEFGAMAQRAEDTNIDLADEALKFIFTIYNILSPDKPIMPDIDSIDGSLTSRIITSIEIALAEGNICKQAINAGAM